MLKDHELRYASTPREEKYLVELLNCTSWRANEAQLILFGLIPKTDPNRIDPLRSYILAENGFQRHPSSEDRRSDFMKDLPTLKRWFSGDERSPADWVNLAHSVGYKIVWERRLKAKAHLHPYLPDDVLSAFGIGTKNSTSVCGGKYSTKRQKALAFAFLNDGAKDENLNMSVSDAISVEILNSAMIKNIDPFDTGWEQRLRDLHRDKYLDQYGANIPDASESYIEGLPPVVKSNNTYKKCVRNALEFLKSVRVSDIPEQNSDGV